MEVAIAATPPKTSPSSPRTTGSPGPFRGRDPACEPRSPMEKRGEAVERGSRRALSGLSMPGQEVVS